MGPEKEYHRKNQLFAKSYQVPSWAGRRVPPGKLGHKTTSASYLLKSFASYLKATYQGSEFHVLE
jgi:hypothetical protein